MDLSNFGKFPSLRDKTVFVTGGGSGIGASIVECFVDQGARVAFVDIDEAANDMRHVWKDVTPDYWDERMAINLRPVFFAIQSVAPQMKRIGSGSIINFGSISWKRALGGMPAYTTAKAAIHGLTRGMARDLGQDSIRVNTVLPGWVMTERQKRLWLDEAGEKVIDQEQCLKGRVLPVDLARIVLFLASDDARMCSAQEFTVDGGWA